MIVYLQLEKLLNLPNDSLTKEIQLTQDLMKLVQPSAKLYPEVYGEKPKKEY